MYPLSNQSFEIKSLKDLTLIKEKFPSLVAFYCMSWIPSRWITHARNYEWEMFITVLRPERNWAEQQFEEHLQVPPEKLLGYHEE